MARLWRWVQVSAFAVATSALVYVSALWWLQGVLDFIAIDVRIVQDAVGWVEQAGPFGLALTALSPAFVLAWHFVQRRDRHRRDQAPHGFSGVADWTVDRPEELDTIVAALTRRGNGTTVGVTTALHGAGGFGKTTLAQMVRADRRVRRRFGDRTVWVTIGRDLRGSAAIVEKVHEVIRQVAPDDAARNAALGRAVTAEAAGRELGALLDIGPRMLLFLDDVWFAEQLQPFVQGGRRCARLVTTRNRQLMHGRGVVVLVDQMSHAQARQVLLYALPPFASEVVAALLEVTGRWPLLLRLTNKILAEAHGAGWDLSDYGLRLLERLRSGGPAAIDTLVKTDDAEALDVHVPHERARAVAATIQAGVGLLAPAEARRLAELAIFARDEVVPLALVTRLWRATCGIDELSVPHLCARLDELALIRLDQADGGRIGMHDVVRDYLHDVLRKESGEDEPARLHGLLLDEVTLALPAEGAWWELGEHDWYLWDNVIGHMLSAGRADRAEALVCDLRWVQARVSRFSPAAALTDLARVGTERTERARRALTRTAHLLVPTDPSIAVIDVLHSRLADDPGWGPQVRALHGSIDRSRLVNHWPLPDLPDRALRHILIGHAGAVSALAISPDGSWLATGAHDHTVRVWDAATGQQRTVLSGHTAPVSALAISPDGSWLATGAHDHTVRVWDAATGRQRTVLSGHGGSVSALAVGPDGDQLASAALDRSVRLWDVAGGGGHRATLQRTGGGWMRAVAIAGGCCLAVSSEDTSVHLSGAAEGTQRTMLQGHANWRRAEVTHHEGSWLAAGGEDSRVRVWEVATGQQRAVLHGLAGRVSAVTISADGSWLATGAHDGGLRIWDAVSGSQRAVLRGHTASVLAGAASLDGSWLATAGQDGTTRVWEVATGRQHAVLHHRHARVTAIAISADGSWLATGGEDGRATVWHVAAAGQAQAVQPERTAPVSAIAASPDGRWLASGGPDGRVRVWEVATGRLHDLLPSGSGEDGRVRLGDASFVLSRHASAVSPDGRWLATGGDDGTIRIRWAATGRPVTMMRVDGRIACCAWIPGTTVLAAGGTAGIYAFTFEPRS